jgi:acetyl esterase/lipase
MVKILKRILAGLGILILLFALLMVTPRLYGLIYPEKAPVGYRFEVLDYLAIKLGLEQMINRDPEVPADIEVIRDIEYKNVDGKSLQLDLFIPKNIKKPVPLLVFIHGGGWKGGKRQDYKVYLVAFAKQGYITATVSYRLLKDGTYPDCVEDISDAVNWFYKNGETYGYDPDRIALIGGSAGGHLALLAAYGWQNHRNSMDSSKIPENDHKVKAVIDLYGPVDLTTLYARNHPLVTNFIGHSYTEIPGLYREASPIQYLSKNVPPTLILHGTSDNLVPISQSDTLKARLDKLGVPCVFYKVPLWPHAMDVDKRVNAYCQEKMSAFLKEYL